ncbi:tRNA lysidine(34) synthetase TilS [Anaerobacillus arseniciselenatis]|uniref:tRNA(Ile)-lysidine synthase n=2 Tax=Anaerobacillus arseniciselenatis TaxID=85682 RepID=A0A1S2LPL4_9BACI|nr:tRNA lysidine(34) synthetase TilS [Anaerobacillus arseniciselenatis]
MKQIVNRFIKKHQLLFDGATVVVGVSGGPDSLALLHFLKGEAEARNLTLVAAHVDHSLRGKESEEDYLFVENYCRENEIIFEGIKIDVEKYRHEHKMTIQVAARECRYRFFQEMMTKHSAQLLALAHHGDDQVETILMRQIRGAYGLGLAGIRSLREFHDGKIIRPFLCLSKEEIIRYCEMENLVPRVDQSNFSSKYMRNRIRNKVLPVLKKENPSVHLKFQQQSELMLDDELFLQDLAEKELSGVLLNKSDKRIVLSISQFNRIRIPLQRRAFQLILNYLYNENMPLISTIHIDDFIDFIKNSSPSGDLHFPRGLLVTKSYDECSLSFMNKSTLKKYEYLLSIPGIVSVKKGKINAEVSKSFPSVHVNHNSIVCDLERLTLPLMVRTRKQGDRIAIKGMTGSKKLKDLFIDEKVDREQRDDWPIIVDGNDQLLWIPGLRRSNIALPSKETKNFVLLTIEEL